MFTALRHIQRAEQRIPNRKRIPEVLVEMFPVNAVVDLMLRGTDEDIAQDRPVRQPDMGMPQLVRATIEQECKHIDAEQSHEMRVLMIHDHIDAGDQLRHYHLRRRVQKVFNGVRPVVGNRRKNFSGVMDLVKMPEQGNPVQKIMDDKKTEIDRDEEGQRK